MQKIILYYAFIPIKDPAAVRLWQHTLAEGLNLKGRILIAGHGINGTLGGEVKDLKAYVKQTKAYPALQDMVFKWSNGRRDDFPKLSVKVRPEIVTFGVPDRIKVNQHGIIGGGRRLKPHQLHRLIAERGDDVVLFDGRSAHEAAIGRFKHAVVPAVQHTRDFVRELQQPKYAALKTKPVVTYCTGGIRCEVLSLLMHQAGFEEVYQLDGGIVKYGEAFGDDGLWEGALYVFDGRISTKFSDRAQDTGACLHCRAKTSNYENCTYQACNKLVLVCKNCTKSGKITCEKVIHGSLPAART